MKRIIIILLAVLAFLFAGIVTIPFFFKNDIKKIAVEKINQSIDATFFYSDFSLSLLKSFPDFTASFHDVSLAGKETFKADTLVSAKEISARINLLSVFKKEGIVVEKISFDRLNINLLVTKEGKANWDIFISSGDKLPKTTSPVDKTSKPLKLKLKGVDVNSMNFVYNDREGNYIFSVLNTGAHFAGELEGALTALDIKLNTPSLTFDYGDVKYVNNAKIDLETRLLADLNTFSFTFENGQSKLNDLPLSVEGNFSMPSDTMLFNIQFGIPGMTMQQVIAMVPDVYRKYFEKVEATGNVSFNGLVSGIYFNDILPRVDVHFNIDNGTIKYPGIPDVLKIEKASAMVVKPEGCMDQLMLGIDQLNLKIGENPIQLNALVKSVMTDPNIDLKLNGTVDFATLTKIFPVDSVTMKGLITANVMFAGNLSDIKKNNFQNFSSSANLNLNDFYFKNNLLPMGASISQGNVSLKNQDLNVSGLSGNVGESDFLFDASLQNLFSYLLGNGKLEGNFALKSKRINANEFMNTSSTPKAGTSPQPTSATPQSTKSSDEKMLNYLNRLHLKFKTSMGQLVYGENTIKDFAGSIELLDQNLTVDGMQATINNSDFRMDGKLGNVFSYMFDNAELNGNFRLASNVLDLNGFLADKATSQKNKTKSSDTASKPVSTNETKPLELPKNMDVVCTATIKRVLYDQMTITDFAGSMKMKDQQLSLSGCGMNLCKGSVKMEGTVIADGRQYPDVNMSLDVNRLDLPSAYEGITLVHKYLPFAAKAEGDISATLKLKSQLGANLKMILATISAGGTFSTHTVRLVDSKTFDSFKSVIKTEKLKNLELQDFTAQFTIQDGNLNLKPFNTKLAGQPVAVSGVYNLGGTLDFRVDATLDRNILSQEIQNIISYVPGQESITTVDVGVDITGDQKRPTVKFDTDKIRQQVVDQVKKSSTKEIKEAAKKLFDKFLK